MLCSHASPNTLKRGLGAIVFLGTFALMEAHIREPNRGEAVAIGTIRAVITGESSYAALYGYYDTLECLAGTRTCVPGIASRNSFVPPNLVDRRGELRGYRVELHAGPKAQSLRNSRVSPSAMTQYAIVAVPLYAGPGHYRAFCGDDRQTIYVTWDEPRVDSGRCLDTSQILQ